MLVHRYRLFGKREKKILGIRSALILCHRQADADAYCAASSLYFFLKRIKRGIHVEVAAPGGFSAIAKKIAMHYETNIKDSPNFHDKDIIIVVDTGSLDLLQEWADSVKRAKAVKAFVDHHPLNKSIKEVADRIISDEKAVSTCEIVYRIFKAHKVKVWRKVAQILLTGIVADSQHLALADASTISIVDDLCKEGASVAIARDLLTLQRDPSEVIARLKGVQRLHGYQLGTWFYASTRIGSFHASLARLLVDAGADIAIACGEVDGETRACLRSSRNFFRQTGIHLGTDVAEKLSSMLEGGKGGGHPTSASLTARVKVDELLKANLSLMETMLSMKAQAIT